MTKTRSTAKRAGKRAGKRPALTVVSDMRGGPPRLSRLELMLTLDLLEGKVRQAMQVRADAPADQIAAAQRVVEECTEESNRLLARYLEGQDSREREAAARIIA